MKTYLAVLLRRIAPMLRTFLVFGLLVSVILLAWFLVQFLVNREPTGSEEFLFAIIATMSGVITVSLFFLLFRQSRRQLPIARNIAIVGFPQSGKTTLIISLFGEMFARRVNLPIAPKGSSTIKRVNEGLAALSTGRPIGPTTSQDRFSFRADVTVNAFPFRRIYKVEFGDFPGDESEDILKEDVEWLHDSEFFGWVLESDAIVFVVDVGRYILDRNAYSAFMSRAIRAAWQEFCQVNIDKRARLAGFPVVLAFTKADLLVRTALLDEGVDRQSRVADAAFGECLPAEIRIDQKDLAESMSGVTRDFADLMKYLTGQTEKFRAIPLSAFGRDQTGILLGFDKFVKSLLP
ncbi:GTPase domain-containing protein [Candidatus Bipolaricaulota bacterium]